MIYLVLPSCQLTAWVLFQDKKIKFNFGWDNGMKFTFSCIDFCILFSLDIMFIAVSKLSLAF